MQKIFTIVSMALILSSSMNADTISATERFKLDKCPKLATTEQTETCFKMSTYDILKLLITTEKELSQPRDIAKANTQIGLIYHLDLKSTNEAIHYYQKACANGNQPSCNLANTLLNEQKSKSEQL
jgi:TPR repeat protein